MTKPNLTQMLSGLAVALTALKFTTLVTVASFLACQAAMASAPEFHFAAAVRTDSSSVERIDLSVQAGHVRILDLPSGVRIEMAAPSEDGETAQTYVRLLQRDGDTYRILHEARRIAPSSVERSFTYAICATKVQFVSPASAFEPECKQ
jgi:hypothetical protein